MSFYAERLIEDFYYRGRYDRMVLGEASPMSYWSLCRFERLVRAGRVRVGA